MAKIPNNIINSIKKFKENIKDDLKITKVFLFGSYAKGKSTKNSDIDVCIIAKQIKNNYLALLKIIPKVIGINEKIEPVVFSEKEYNSKKNFGLLKEIKQTGIEI